jgi:hypothetical protein
MHHPSRLLLLVVAIATALSACQSAGPAGAETPIAGAPNAARVNAAMGTVASHRQELQSAVSGVLAAASRVEPLAAGLRSPTTIDVVIDDVPGIVSAFDVLEPSTLVPVVEALDLAIGQAAGLVDQAAALEAVGSWERQFLAAQRSVLDALAGWSVMNANAIALLDEQWPVFDEVVRDAAVLKENRWRYRNPEEAAGTWEVEAGSATRAVRDASALLPGVVNGLAQAAERVRGADAELESVFRARPAS